MDDEFANRAMDVVETFRRERRGRLRLVTLAAVVTAVVVVTLTFVQQDPRSMLEIVIGSAIVGMIPVIVVSNFLGDWRREQNVFAATLPCLLGVTAILIAAGNMFNGRVRWDRGALLFLVLWMAIGALVVFNLWLIRLVTVELRMTQTATLAQPTHAAQAAQPAHPDQSEWGAGSARERMSTGAASTHRMIVARRAAAAYRSLADRILASVPAAVGGGGCLLVIGASLLSGRGRWSGEETLAVAILGVYGFAASAPWLRWPLWQAFACGCNFWVGLLAMLAAIPLCLGAASMGTQLHALIGIGMFIASPVAIWLGFKTMRRSHEQVGWLVALDFLPNDEARARAAAQLAARVAEEEAAALTGDRETHWDEGGAGRDQR